MFKKNTGNQEADRRSSPRKRLKAMVKVEREKVHITERASNYSLTGLFFRSNFPEQYRLKDPVRISFEDEKGVSQSHAGKVVRKSKDGVGIRFRNKKK